MKSNAFDRRHPESIPAEASLAAKSHSYKLSSRNSKNNGQSMLAKPMLATPMLAKWVHTLLRGEVAQALEQGRKDSHLVQRSCT